MIEIQIGKNGVTQGLLDHVKDACSSHQVIKLDFLQSYTRQATIPDGLSRVTAYLDPLYDVDVDVKGHTATLHVEG